MAFPNINPTETQAWQKLREHFDQICYVPMQQLFLKDPNRAQRFQITWKDFLLDFSKNKIDLNTIKYFTELAREMQLKTAIEAYFSGEKINKTENRAVLHTALRANAGSEIWLDGKNIMHEVVAVRQKIKEFSDAVIKGKLRGFSGKPFTDIVNIGIGGSDLGSNMVVEALGYYRNHLKVHYLSNIDGDSSFELLKKINPETTLFVVVTKTFTTQETLTNAQTLKEWFLKEASVSDIGKHFVAVTSDKVKAEAFGIVPEFIFPIWDWVGGRFSLWSAVGLIIALAVGYENFEKLLSGAHDADQYFRQADFSQNIPVVLAFLSIWYNNFFDADTHGVVPYSTYLKKFVPYLQQLSMESNGKDIDRDGNPVNTHTGNIIFGGEGTDSQHAFFQLLHQGTKLIPVDFIGFKESLSQNQEHHDKLMANFFAQTEALLNGKEPRNSDKFSDLFKRGYGDRPTNTLLIRKLTPENLGALLAIYEHKTFVEGFLWNIFSFDQFGVELGKELATSLLEEIKNKNPLEHDGSTLLLLQHYLKK